MVAPVGAQFLAPVKKTRDCVVYALVNLQRVGAPDPVVNFTPHWVIFDPARQQVYRDYAPDLTNDEDDFPIVPVDRGTLLTVTEELKSYLDEFISKKGTVIYDFDVPVPPACPPPPPPVPNATPNVTPSAVPVAVPNAVPVSIPVKTCTGCVSQCASVPPVVATETVGKVRKESQARADARAEEAGLATDEAKRNN